MKSNKNNFKIKLFPIFAGLDSTYFGREIRGSIFHANYYTPHRYSDDDLISIVNQFIPNNREDAKLWKAITFLNKHPRMLDSFIEDYIKTSDAHKSYSLVYQHFKHHYGKTKLTNLVMEKILGYTITETPIDDHNVNDTFDSYTIQQLEDYGYVRLDNNRLTMSLPMIQMCLDQLGTHSGTFKSFFRELISAAFDVNRHHGVHFEKFNALYELVLNQSFLFIGQDRLSLTERFRGVIFNNETLNSRSIYLDTFPSIYDEYAYLTFNNNQKNVQISNLVHNTRSAFFDRIAKAKIDDDTWTILWQDIGTVSDYDCFTAPAVETIIENHFTESKLACIDATKEKSLPIIVTTKPFASTVTSLKFENIGFLGRDGLEQYYGSFIFRSYVLNVPIPFPINKPNLYSDFELALFLGLLTAKAKTIRSNILKGENISSTELKAFCPSVNLDLISFDSEVDQ